jgi:hypothetical protein
MNLAWNAERDRPPIAQDAGRAHAATVVRGDRL